MKKFKSLNCILTNLDQTHRDLLKNWKIFGDSSTYQSAKIFLKMNLMFSLVGNHQTGRYLGTVLA